MKVLVAIAVDDDGGVGVDGLLQPCDEMESAHVAGSAINRLHEDCGSDAYRLLWAEIEIPPPPPALQAEAKEVE